MDTYEITEGTFRQMSEDAVFLMYALVFRMGIITAGIVTIILGYKLLREEPGDPRHRIGRRVADVAGDVPGGPVPGACRPRGA